LLLPWRTVLDNAALGMEIQGVPMRAARERALPLLQRYGLAGFEHLYPGSLSGGMRQRAALLRTLLFDTDIILLDEPFGALDAKTKLQMQEWLLQLWHDFRKTVVFVTHDVEEAIFLGDEVVVMGTRPGRILETIAVPVARPRLRRAALSPEFLEIKERCLELLNVNTPVLGKAACRSPRGAAGHRRPAEGDGGSHDACRIRSGETRAPPPGRQGLAGLGHRHDTGRHPGRGRRPVGARGGQRRDRCLLL